MSHSAENPYYRFLIFNSINKRHSSVQKTEYSYNFVDLLVKKFPSLEHESNERKKDSEIILPQ